MCVCPKTLGQPREVKNGQIILKFDTQGSLTKSKNHVETYTFVLVHWMNTLEMILFHFLKISLFGPLEPVFPRGSLTKSKMAQSCVNLVSSYKCRFDEYLGVLILFPF